ncbi:protein translocase subunit SecF [Kitasatospora sp. NPDC088346]|uniref:protein translocase subunit SecF n=1 Tax=Kitasatospora sp. NPDC088346 TaxID=3364073 RepID=UPI0038132B79
MTVSERLRRFTSTGRRLAAGESVFDICGRRRLWYTLSAVLVLVVTVALTTRGLHLGIEFQGGAQYTVAAPGVSVADAAHAVHQVTGHDALVQATGSGQLRIQLPGSGGAGTRTASALADALHIPRPNVSTQIVGPSWGAEVSHKALLGLAIFLVLVTGYLAVAFEWRMALAALAALLHDLLITVGVYAVTGFEVTPGTVIGFLTILGYSLYDTVVVFDSVREHTRGRTGPAYGRAANRALNATLIRSANTTVLALLPVAALLFIGAGLLGAGTLTDIALALFVGLAAGAYSSLFLATPILAQLKERRPVPGPLTRRRPRTRHPVPTTSRTSV